jgi:hypothetical protein
MAQIIKHRRGSLEALSAVTASLQKGELVIASGSSNLSVNNGSSLVFAAVENGQVQAVNRFLTGDDVPNSFAGSTYNGLVKGVPYYASGSSTLYLLGTDTNEAINLIGNIQPFSASIDSRLDAIEVSIGGDGSIGTRVSLLEAFTGSQESKNSTLATYTASVDGRLSQLEADSGSQDGRLDVLETKASTLSTYTASIDVHVSNVNAFTSSQESKNSTLGVYTASIDTKLSTLGTYTASVNSRLDQLSTDSGSQASRLSGLETYTGSNDTLNTEQNARLTTLESVSGSYAKLAGGNIFTGTQTITGSLYITNDLIVQGSSSLQNISASSVDIGTNQINLNTAVPALRYAGINVYDSGSSGVSASLQWDSFTDQWIFVHKESGSATVDSSILLYGPLSNGGVGSEATLTSNFLTKVEDNGHGHHLTTSSIEDTGTKVTVHNSLDVTGTISGSIAGIGNVTAFSTSVDSRLDSVESAIGGGSNIDSRLTTLEAFTGSQESKNLTLEAFSSSVNTFTGSQESKNSTLATYTGSVDTQLSTLGIYTASVDVHISNVNTFTGSQESKNSTLATYTGSVDSKFSTLSTYTASVNTQLSTLGVYTASVDSKFSTLSTYTASVNSRLDQLSTDSGSQAGRLDVLETKANTLGTYTASVDTKFTAIGGSTASLNTFTASAADRLTNIELFTSSFGTTFSTSVDSRLDTLEGTGTIQGVGTTNDVIFNKVSTTGDVVIGGDLVVQGNTVTLNTSQLIVEDKLITLASGSTNNLTADGAGFEISATNASFKYDGILNQFSSSVHIATTITGSVNLGASAGSTKRIAFRNTNGNLDLVPTASVAGDIVQWDGTDFVMSNVIDGGSF